jgi:hypothetical protein
MLATSIGNSADETPTDDAGTIVGVVPPPITAPTKLGVLVPPNKDAKIGYVAPLKAPPLQRRYFGGMTAPANAMIVPTGTGNPDAPV